VLRLEERIVAGASPTFLRHRRAHDALPEMRGTEQRVLAHSQPARRVRRRTATARVSRSWENTPIHDRGVPCTELMPPGGAGGDYEAETGVQESRLLQGTHDPSRTPMVHGGRARALSPGGERRTQAVQTAVVHGGESPRMAFVNRCGAHPPRPRLPSPLFLFAANTLRGNRRRTLYGRGETGRGLKRPRSRSTAQREQASKALKMGGRGDSRFELKTFRRHGRPGRSGRATEKR